MDTLSSELFQLQGASRIPLSPKSEHQSCRGPDWDGGSVHGNSTTERWNRCHCRCTYYVVQTEISGRRLKSQCSGPPLLTPGAQGFAMSSSLATEPIGQRPWYL